MFQFDNIDNLSCGIENRPSTFRFKGINTNTIRKLVCKLPEKSKIDILNMDSRLLRLSAIEITPVLSHIFSLSLQFGIVLPQWKQSRITPIYKGKGDVKEYSNYRPISVLPHIVKLLNKYFTTN